MSSAAVVIGAFRVNSLRSFIFSYTSGYKLVCQFPLHAEAVCHNWLLLRLSAISCFLPRLLYMINGFLLSFRCYSASCRDSAGSKIMQTVTAGSHFLRTVGALVAHWVKPWPTDLGVPSLSPARGEIFSTVNEVSLHTAFHYHLSIVLI